MLHARGSQCICPSRWLWREIFLYSEETDLSFRMMKLGWVSMYVPAAMCQHIGGGSTKFGNDIRHGYMMRSELYFFRKSFGKRSYYAAIIFRFLSGFLKLIPFALLNMVSCGKIYFFSYRVARSLADIKYSILTIDDPRGVNIPPKPGSLLVGTNACRPSKTMVSKWAFKIAYFEQCQRHVNGQYHWQRIIFFVSSPIAQVLI